MEQSHVVHPEKGEEIYLDSFSVLQGTDAFILTTHHSPDLAYSAMATQLPATCAVFLPGCVWRVPSALPLLAPSWGAGSEFSTGSGTFHTSRSPFQSVLPRFLNWNTSTAGWRQSPVWAQGMVVQYEWAAASWGCWLSQRTILHAGALQRWEEQQYLQALHRARVPWWEMLNAPWDHPLIHW